MAGGGDGLAGHDAAGDHAAGDHAAGDHAAGDHALTATLRSESDRIIAAADGAHVDAPVPACPGWTVADVVDHLGRVYERVTTRLGPDAPDPGAGEGAGGAPDSGAGAGLRRRRDGLLARFETVGLDAPAATFTGPGTVRFWLRRQAHETRVHRVDVDQALGLASPPLAAGTAADGVAEVLWLVTLDDRWRVLGDAGTLHAHCTDTVGEWMLRWDDSGVALTEEHAKGDLAVRGPADGLMRLLWNRGRADDVEVLGDAGLLDRFTAAVP